MDEFEFQRLIDLCRITHEHLQHQAARSVDTALVVRNWMFGWYIVEYEQNGADRAAYGSGLLEKLSSELGRGFSVRTLRQCRTFYNRYGRIRQTLSAELALPAKLSDDKSLEIRQALSAELAGRLLLSWSHYVVLMTIDDPQERRFYEIEAAENSWSVRELQRQMASSLYERLALSRNKDDISRLAQEGLVVEKAADIIKNPLVLEFLDLQTRPVYSESELETAIIDQLESFLLELGKGFLFEARQKRFTFDNDHFYVDLVFYNRLLRCYVLIDLKRDKLTHQDLGQMQMYVNYFDRHVKTDDESPTVGILLCHRKNNALVELTLPHDANIYASKYQLYLPSKEQLRQKLMDWTAAQLTQDPLTPLADEPGDE
jgi:predicted nuclease of restriction endonuclease-like (RecB) superfamily